MDKLQWFSLFLFEFGLVILNTRGDNATHGFYLYVRIYDKYYMVFLLIFICFCLQLLEVLYCGCAPIFALHVLMW